MDEQVWAAPDSGADDASAVAPLAAPRPDPDSPTDDHPTPPPLPVPLRPMTLSDLLDGAFAVIKARPRTVFTIAAVILVPSHVVASFLQRDAASSLSITSSLNAFNTAGRTTASGADILWVYVAAALLALSLFFLGGAMGRLVTGWYAGGDPTAGEALAASFRRTPAILVIFFALLPVKVLSSCGCYVGVIPIVSLFSLTAPVLVVEGLGPFAAAGRSWRLIARRFWACLGIVVLAALGSTLLTSVFGLIPTLLASLLPPPLDWVATAAVSAGVSLIVTTALVSVSVLLYIDLRIRTEGLDIELGASDAFAHAR